MGNDYPLKVILLLPFPSFSIVLSSNFSQAWGQKPPRDPKSKPAAAVFSHSLGAPGTEVTAAKHQFVHVDRFGCVMLCLNIYKFTRFVWISMLYNYPKITSKLKMAILWIHPILYPIGFSARGRPATCKWCASSQSAVGCGCARHLKNGAGLLENEFQLSMWQ